MAAPASFQPDPTAPLQAFSADPPWRAARADWQAAILVCGKCSRRIGGGFGKKRRQSLAKVLRKLGNGRTGRKADFGVIEIGCLKLCPKNAVVALNGAEPGRWQIVPAGAEPRTVAQRLGLAILPAE